MRGMIKYLNPSPAESPGARTSPGTYSPAGLADMSQIYPEQSGGGDGGGLHSNNEDATLDTLEAHSTNAGTSTNELPRTKELPLKGKMPVVPVFIRLNVSERADSVEHFPKKNVQPSNHAR